MSEKTTDNFMQKLLDLSYAETIKFCEGYLPDCDTKKRVIEAVKQYYGKGV